MSQNFASVANVLNRTFEEPLADLVNRSNPFLAALTKKGVSSQEIYLKAAVDSDHAAGAVADGSDVTFSGDEKTDYINPTLPWATYVSKFSVPKRLIEQVANNPGSLGNILWSEIENAAKDLSNKIASDIFAGSVSNGLVGLQTVVDDSNTYAGIDRSSADNANFRSVVIDHTDGEVTPAGQELNTAILYQLDEEYFNANGYGWSEMPGLFTGITSSGVLSKYKALMENIDLSSLSTAHFVNQANTVGRLGIGQTGFMGVPFIRDRNVNATGDLDDTSRLYFFDMSKIHLCVLNPSGNGMVHTVKGYESAPEVDGVRTQIEILGNTGESVKGYVKTYIQLATSNPKAAGAVIKNILTV